MADNQRTKVTNKGTKIRIKVASKTGKTAVSKLRISKVVIGSGNQGTSQTGDQNQRGKKSSHISEQDQQA